MMFENKSANSWPCLQLVHRGLGY